MADELTALADPVDLPSTRARGGVLSGSKAVPGGVDHDVIVRTVGCVEPIVQDGCLTDGTDDRENVEDARTDTHVFKVFPIESAAECSTIPGVPNEEIARTRLDGTTEWALGRQLEQNLLDNGSPYLDDPDYLTVLGTVADADFVAAVSCLEQAAASNGFGVEWVLHAPVRAAAYLAADNLLVDGKSPTGAPWIISPGYEPRDATTVRLWVTGSVWAAVDTVDVRQAVGHRMNQHRAQAFRNGLVAFDPCLLYAIDVTVPACPS